MVERSRLGRGLDFFLSGSKSGDAAPDAMGAVAQIAVGDLIPNPHQPRREFAPGELRDLAASIRSAGVLQPILARRVGDRHQIIAGERRWRAAQEAGLETVPVLVREVTDEQAAVFGLVENLHREDLNPVEKAQAFRRLLEVTRSSQDELARQVGLERSTVTNFLRLLDLPGEVLAHVSRGTLSMGQARALLGLPDDEERRRVADEAIRRRMSVRQVEVLVQSLKGKPPPTKGADASPAKSGAARERPLWLREIEDNLEEVLQTAVAVRYASKRSTITIECLGRDEFERIYERLKNA